MASLISKPVENYGPYLYHVSRDSTGKQDWVFLGRVDSVSLDPGPTDLTSDEAARRCSAGRVAPDESPPGTEHGREYHVEKLDWILDDMDAEYDPDGDFYDSKTRWEIDKVSEHYQTEHDLRVALTNIEDSQQLREVVADIEEAREVGLLDGIEKIKTADSDTLSERHGTDVTINAEYEPEPRDIVGNSMGYRPTVTLNADTYRNPDADTGVTSHGNEKTDVRHAWWHELAHHEHLREYHEERVDVREVMQSHDGATWDRMHDAMDPYRDAIGDEYGASVRHDPIEFYAEARADLVAGADVPGDIEDAVEALRAGNVLTNDGGA